MRIYGLFTELQVKVLIYRSKGLSLREVAKLLGTSHQNISIAEKRALENLSLAKRTILVYNIISSPVRVIISKGTHLVDIPKIIVSECDKNNIKLKADFTLLYKLLRFYAPNCIVGTKVVEPIIVLVDKNGYVNIYPYNEIKDIFEAIIKYLK